MDIRRERFFHCVRCYGNLTERAEADLACATCQAIYPSIGGIRVLVAKPYRLLRLQAGRVAEKKETTAGHRRRLAETQGDGHPPEAWSRALEGYDGWLANLDLLDRLLQPARDHLATQPAPASPLDDFLLESGWPSYDMLGYFYRDWSDTKEARLVTDLVTGALAKHGSGEREAIAVLGCGACRLVHDLSDLFPAVFGVELAVDSLLLARALLDGAQVNLHFNFPRPHIPIEQKVVRIEGPARRADSIELVAADVSRLPFASGSLQYVITQYLLDIIANPESVFREIRRVLAPGGLWINFSNLSESNSPLAVRAFDQVNNLDRASFLRQHGFVLREESMHRFNYLDLAGLSPWAAVNTETPVFFVAQKEAAAPEPADAIAGYFSRGDDAVWALVPRISTPVHFIHGRTFTAQGVEEVRRLELPRTSRRLSREMALLAESLLLGVDGKRSLGQLLGGLKASYSNLVGEDDFLTLFSELADLELIALSTP